MQSYNLITVFSFLFILLFSNTSKAAGSCENADIISGKLITDVCWDCIYPIRIAGIPVSPDGDIPSEAASSPLCACDNAGIPQPGVVTSMWEPARLIEIQRTPGCSSVLNGADFGFDPTFIGSTGNGEFDGGDGSFYHYHYYSFPLLSILELFAKPTCSSDGFSDLDIMYLSEVDATWNNSELAFFTHPEASVVSNPLATAACSADAIASTAGNPLSSMFWCAGSWGNMYPFSGHSNGGKGIIKDSSLLKARLLSALHRRGLSWKTMGEDTLCEAKVHPTLPKTQYKFSMMYPVAESNSDHVIGESTLGWGAGRLIPGVANTPVYLTWRWTDCCNY